jgi:hypothetical protein
MWHGHLGHDLPQAGEAVKKSGDLENISRKGAKARRRKENKAIILCGLCDLAPLREIVYFFTPSQVWVSRMW